MERNLVEDFQSFVHIQIQNLPMPFSYHQLEKKFKVGNPELKALLSSWVRAMGEDLDSPFLFFGSRKGEAMFFSRGGFETRMGEQLRYQPFFLNDTQLHALLSTVTGLDAYNESLLFTLIDQSFFLARFFSASGRGVTLLNLHKKFVPEMDAFVQAGLLEELREVDARVWESFQDGKPPSPEKKGFLGKKDSPKPSASGTKLSPVQLVEKVYSACSFVFEKQGGLLFPLSDLEGSPFFSHHFPEMSPKNWLEKVLSRAYPMGFTLRDGWVSLFPENWLDLNNLPDQVETPATGADMAALLSVHFPFLNDRERKALQQFVGAPEQTPAPVQVPPAPQPVTPPPAEPEPEPVAPLPAEEQPNKPPVLVPETPVQQTPETQEPPPPVPPPEQVEELQTGLIASDFFAEKEPESPQPEPEEVTQPPESPPEEVFSANLMEDLFVSEEPAPPPEPPKEEPPEKEAPLPEEATVEFEGFSFPEPEVQPPSPQSLEDKEKWIEGQIQSILELVAELLPWQRERFKQMMIQTSVPENTHPFHPKDFPEDLEKAILNSQFWLLQPGSETDPNGEWVRNPDFPNYCYERLLNGVESIEEPGMTPSLEIPEPVEEPGIVSVPAEEAPSVDATFAGKSVAFLTDQNELFQIAQAIAEKMGFHLYDSLSYMPEVVVFDKDYEYLLPIARSTGARVCSLAEFKKVLRLDSDG